MKIEFRKIPLNSTEFEINSNSVKFLGSFSKISSKLAKIEGSLSGFLKVECCTCGIELEEILEEKVSFVASDGIHETSNENDEEFIVIEVDDHMLDFNDVLHSELESLKSEYYICDACKKNDNFVEIEY